MELNSVKAKAPKWIYESLVDSSTSLGKSISSALSVGESPVIETKTGPIKIRPSTWRYSLLLLMGFVLMTNSFQWIQYACINKVIRDFYDVTTFWINSTTVIYMIIYLIGVVPASLIYETFGIRACIVLSSGFNTLALWIKCLAWSRNKFWLVMIGQALAAFSNLFISMLPSAFSATWFPETQVSTAIALGVFGSQAGTGLGFIIPTLVVLKATGLQKWYAQHANEKLNDDQFKAIQRSLLGINCFFASVTFIVFVMVLVYFRNEPRHPPSKAQAFLRIRMRLQAEKIQDDSQRLLGEIYKSLSQGNEFILLLTSYGLNIAVFSAFNIVLAQMIAESMGHEYLSDVGYIGLDTVLGGLVGTLACSYLLNRWRDYKLMQILFTIMTMFGIILFYYSLKDRDLLFLYSSVGVIGFFSIGGIPVADDFAAEITYPLSDGICASMMNTASQLFSILITFISSPLIEYEGTHASLIFYCIILLMSAFVTFGIHVKYRRQEAAISNLFPKKDDSS